MPIRARAKRYRVAFLALAALALSACAGWKRLAPPGIVRYENLAGDQPQNPQIKERVAERKAERTPVFPDLTQTPKGPPEPLGDAEQDALKADILAARDALNENVAADRTAAEEVRATPIALPGENGALSLEDARDALAEKLETDEAKARAERGLKPKVKPAPPE